MYQISRERMICIESVFVMSFRSFTLTYEKNTILDISNDTWLEMTKETQVSHFISNFEAVKLIQGQFFLIVFN